jgi:hypothetical protein
MKNDGGPAYPSRLTIDSSGTRIWPEEFGRGGMSLRDWFAGQALVGFIAAPLLQGECFPPAEALARMSYAQADAMLAERVKP